MESYIRKLLTKANFNLLWSIDVTYLQDTIESIKELKRKINVVCTDSHFADATKRQSAT